MWSEIEHGRQEGEEERVKLEENVKNEEKT